MTTPQPHDFHDFHDFHDSHASGDMHDVTADGARAPGRGLWAQTISVFTAYIRHGWSRWHKGVLALVMAVTLLLGQPALANGMGNGQGRPSAPPPPTVPPGKPHHANPTAGTKSVLHAPPSPKGLPPFTPLSQEPPLSHGFVPSMKPGKLVLSPTQDTTFLGSDGRLEIDVPAAAITAADVTAAGGQVVLQVTEVAPASGSNAGGSGIVSFGSYLVRVQDAQGNPFTHGLRVPATLKLHYGKLRGVDLSRAFVTFNGSHPKAVTNLGPFSSQAATNDPQHQLLRVQLPADPQADAASSTSSLPIGAKIMLGSLTAASCQCGLPNTVFTWSTFAPIAKFGNPDPFNVDLNAGSLTEGTQIDVPPGPAQAMPNITLAYNSSAVNESHSPQGAAGWVGEGWSLSLGSITWAEHNVWSNQCSGTGCTNGNWEDSWMLNDPFGTSTELIPPNNATSTYYDDTPNWYCTTSTSATPCPIQFQTARQTYAKVYAYVGPNTLGGAPDHPACFRVYLTNGVMEEFGCTADSLQYYPIQKNSQPGQTNNDLYYTTAWLLDMITNPQGNQVHITYQKDSETAPDGLTYPRDVVMSTIEWDSKGCVNAQTMCTGSSWQPLYRVQFAATHHSVTRLTNTPANCNTDTSVRCDDPATISGGISAPLINGTFVLNDINVQINTSSQNGGTYNGSAWNTLRDYQLSYEQSGPTTITDPVTNKQEQAAGYLDLTQVQEVGDGNGNGASSYPPMTYTYTSQTEYYEDGAFTPAVTTLCGPSWNTGGNGGTCDLWSQTYDGNSRYLASAYNGQGEQRTFSWVNARNNTHGVTGSTLGTDIANPLYCNSHQTGYPCNSADDEAWSRVVVAGRTDTVTQLTQSGQGGVQTTTPINSNFAYTYQLTYPLAAQDCSDCVAGMYWGNQNDGDYLDYYNAKFMGFAASSVSNPDGSVVTHQFYSTQGFGIYSTSVGLTCPSTLPPVSTTCHAAPWWNIQNAGHGLETGALYYDTDGVTLLKQTSSAYNAVCPAGGASATPAYSAYNSTYGPWNNSSGVGQQVAELDHNNPVAVCDVQLTQTTSTTWDGQSTNSVTDTAAYTYDSSGRVTQVTRTSNSGGASPKKIVEDTGYQTINTLAIPAAQTANNTPQTSGWSGSYVLTLVNSSDIQDGLGNKTSCTAANYGTSGNTTAAPTERDEYTACGGTALKTTMAYDNLGNQTSATDADGNTGVSGHSGASGTACAGATICTNYGDATQAVTTQTANAANQSSTIHHTFNAADGFGQWPASTTDENGQTTSYTYDALGRTAMVQESGQTSPPTQQSWHYVLCLGQSGQPPCYEEVDTAQRLSSSSTVLTRTFYDGQGNVVETRRAAPGGQDVIQYTLYDVDGRTSQRSEPYFVSAYTGTGGVAAAFSIPDTSPSVSVMTTTYDGLQRILTVTDPLSEVSSKSYGVVCNAPGTNDTGCYEQTLALDANHHQTGILSDGFGRQIYAQRYSGNAGPFTLYSTTGTTYDTSGRVVQQLHADGTSKTTYTYDTTGQLTATSDPDLGSTTFSYDANGNRTQQVDARGASGGTTYLGYDGLNRPIWRSTTNSASGAYVTYSYDGTANGSYGAGRLSAEVFQSSTGTGATSFSGAYTYTYDALGRTTRVDQTMGGAGACPPGWTCQDIGSPALAGSQSYAGDGQWTVTGGGSDIWGTSDQFHFVSQSQAGDATVSMHVDSQTPTDQWAKVGPMVRASNAANAAYYALQATPGNGINVQYRDSTGGSAAILAQTTGAASQTPIWLAVARSGTTYSAYTSQDGTNWTYVQGSSRTMSGLSGAVLMGPSVVSHSASAASTVLLDSVSVMTNGTGACPSGWTCQDIGGPTPAGTQNYLGNGEWNVVGGGADIWGTSDQFRFISQAQASDGSISARVEAQTNSNAWAKAGVMMRAGTAANAAYYAVEVTPSNGISVQDRSSAGASAAIVASVSSYSLPLFVKVTRSSTTLTAYTSSDGVNWTAISGSTVALSALSGTVQAGIEVTSHNTSASSTATIDTVSPTVTAPTSVTATALPTPAAVTSYPTQESYDDAGTLTRSVYPDGESVIPSYTGQDWLAGLSTTLNGTTTTLLSNVSYSGSGGAVGQITAANLANGTYSQTTTYDALARPTETSLTLTNGNTLLFDTRRAFDAVGNVANVWTTLPSGTDNQAFCYDEHNRLTWASSATGTVPCGGAWTAGSLPSAVYTNTYTYDTLDRLTSGPNGSYTYGNSAHLDAVTAIGSAYTAAYDAAGNMTCRAPTSSATCAGTQTGAQLTFDNEARLSAWQNAPGSNPSSSTKDLYDGEGNRVEQQVSSSGTTTTITYISNIEEVSTTGGATTTTTSYYAGGKRIAQAVNGVFSYLGSDGLGSAEVAVDGSGNVQASTLYDPYGNTRYSNGTMPGSYGYTGQHADTATGLDYYNARYYDPVAGQFISADTVHDGLNRYGYVHGDPTSATDPTGHFVNCLKFIFGEHSRTDGVGCGIDAFFGASAGVQIRATHQLFRRVGQRFGSGNWRFLNDEGAAEFGRLQGVRSWLRRGARTFDIRNLWGGGKSTTDVAAEDLKNLVAEGSEFIRVRGVGGGRIAGKLARLRGAIDDVSEGLKGWSHVGTGLTIVGAALVTVTSGLDDYGKHHNAARAVGVGLLHGVLSTGGAYLGGAIGAAAGAVCGPLAFACAPAFGFVGASVGGWLGDELATQIVNHIDDGSIANAVGNASKAVGNITSGIGNALGSLFG